MASVALDNAIKHPPLEDEFDPFEAWDDMAMAIWKLGGVGNRLGLRLGRSHPVHDAFADIAKRTGRLTTVGSTDFTREGRLQVINDERDGLAQAWRRYIDTCYESLGAQLDEG